jgi:multidrug efflux pump subunit AcrA (membrane-fusion protein)
MPYTVDRNVDQTSVLTVTATHKLENRPVRLGIATPNRVEVVSGLLEGDLVVLGNRGRLRPGTPVTPKLVVVSER